MSERAKVLLYTVVASTLLFVAVERFLGTTDEYASRLDIKSTPIDPNWDPENEIVNERAPINAAAPVRAEADPNLSMPGVPSQAPDEGREGEEEDEPPEHDEDEERLTVADTERLDSDGDMEEESLVVVPGMSPEEAALLERIDGDLLRRRPPTRALDLVLAGCTVGGGTGEGDAGATPVTVRPNLTLGVLFRHGSVAIKGASLNRVDALVERFRRCDTALLVVQPNPEGRVDVNDDPRLVTRREEELKYYLLQRRVPSDSISLPESP